MLRFLGLLLCRDIAVYSARCALRLPHVGEANRERFEGLALHDDVAAPYGGEANSRTIEAQELEAFEVSRWRLAAQGRPVGPRRAVQGEGWINVL